jgi:hypothetical protein
MKTSNYSAIWGARPSRSQFLSSLQEYPLRLIFLAVIVLAALTRFDACAQIQQAWVARYDNGITNGTNQAVKMAIDSSGNIYVAGVSQNTNSNLGYVTIKYAPAGNQLWAVRYDSTNFPSAMPTGLVLDPSNNVIVTGSALTLKYDSNGNQLWTAPYSGTALAVDAGANVYVTGFGTNFNMVKLNPAGSNVWFTTYVDVGPTLSQVVLVDSATNIYLAGSDVWIYWGGPGQYYVQLTIIKYNASGNQLWKATYDDGSFTSVHIGGTALDSEGNLYLIADFSLGPQSFVTFKYNSNNGSLVWVAFNPSSCGNDVSRDLMVNRVGNAIVTGHGCYLAPDYAFATGTSETYVINSNGALIWTNNYPVTEATTSGGGNAIALDSSSNCYVTGFAIETNSQYGIFTIKYNPSGNQIWLQRYSSPGNGNAAGNAIAVDNNGNVYVAGYDTTAAGGTEMVLIKYSPVTLQRRADGTVLLEAEGSPGESFDIRASQDLLNWLDLGIVLADTNGLMQFDDTNAPNYPARFYYTNPQ